MSLLLTAFTDPALGVWGLAAGDGPLAVSKLDGTEVTHGLAVAGHRDVALHHASDTPLLETCWIEGPVTVDGTEHDARIGGLRATVPFDKHSESARLLGGWLLDSVSLGLLAVRPAKAKGQDKDRIEVALDVACDDAEPEKRPTTIFDPRLSTTYGADEQIRRVGVELWLGQDEDGDQRPLRLGGEALGAAAAVTVESGRARIAVQPLLVHTSTAEGLGLYLLVRSP